MRRGREGRRNKTMRSAENIEGLAASNGAGGGRTVNKGWIRRVYIIYEVEAWDSVRMGRGESSNRRTQRTMGT